MNISGQKEVGGVGEEYIGKVKLGTWSFPAITIHYVETSKTKTEKKIMHVFFTIECERNL